MNATLIHFILYLASKLTETGKALPFPLFFGTYSAIADEYKYDITDEYSYVKYNQDFQINRDKLFKICEIEMDLPDEAELDEFMKTEEFEEIENDLDDLLNLEQIEEIVQSSSSKDNEDEDEETQEDEDEDEGRSRMQMKKKSVAILVLKILKMTTNLMKF